LNENETIESVLCGHSELLVIALNLIQEPAPKFIQVVKNLRICGHCHEFTKVIAKIEQCDIVVRDANRIHHFYPNGQCGKLPDTVNVAIQIDGTQVHERYATKQNDFDEKRIRIISKSSLNQEILGFV
ncbi:unnamed protein product, partial [Rotaria magnacalcarata]